MGKIILENVITQDVYTDYVMNTFDIQDREKTLTEINYNLSEAKNFDWNIGVILGGSGSGKTSLLKKMGVLRYSQFDNRSLISNFDFLSPEEATALLLGMGLSSVPSWLRPFSKLSNGEQYRAILAYLVATSGDSCILVDEFTSVVNRDVAKSMSFTLQKYLRKHNKRIILASCHYDILDWLQPDWTCDLQKGGVLEKHEYLRHDRPKIELQVSRVKYEAWEYFKKHHYLTEDVNKACKFLLFEWEGKPVAINAVIPQPSGHFKNGVRESRIVVLPDYQGIGLGTVVSNISGAMFKAEGYRYFTKTIHPALGEYRNRTPELWKPTSKNGKKDTAQNQMGNMEGWKVLTRTSYCHEFIGEDLKGFKELLKSIKEFEK